jgi:hypothetical protein
VMRLPHQGPESAGDGPSTGLRHKIADDPQMALRIWRFKGTNITTL